MAQKSIIQKISKKYSADVCIASKLPEVEYVNTGNYALNRVLSGNFLKGYPTGKILEIYGENSTGKSMLLCYAIKEWQKKFGSKAYVIVDDTENCWEMDVLGKIVGADCDRVMMLHSATVEEHNEKVFFGKKNNKGTVVEPSMVQSILEVDKDARIMIVLDSVAQLTTEHELGSPFGTVDMGKAKLVGKGLRTADKVVAKNRMLYFVANQLRDRIGGYGGKVTTSGKSMGFIATLRISLRKVTGVSVMNPNVKKEVEAGIVIEAFVTKSKVSAPMGKCEMEYIFLENDKKPLGLNPVSGATEFLALDGIILPPERGQL